MIDLTVVEGSDELIIQIMDSGPGIPEDCMEKIFEVFYTTKKRGTGLGLPISRKIVNAHGGSLTVTNNPGGGATFSVVLPVQAGNV